VAGALQLVDRPAAVKYLRAVPGDESSDAATFVIGGPVSSAWREEMLTRANELAGLKSWVAAQGEHDGRATDLLCATEEHLNAVRQTAAGKNEHKNNGGRIKRLWRGLTGASFERALGNLDAAEVHLLRAAPSSVLIPALPSVVAHVNRYLSKHDPRRHAVDRIAGHHIGRMLHEPEAHLGHERPSALGHEQWEMVLSAHHAANSQRRRDFIRLRTFRNFLWGGIVVFALIGIGLGVLGSISPTTIPLCLPQRPKAESRSSAPARRLLLGR
jgi:hypothetical protein